MAEFSQAVPELPVRDLGKAVDHNRDALGFEPHWENADARMVGIARGDGTVFLREVGDVPPHVCWVVVEDLSAAHGDLRARLADLVFEPEDKPWGLRDFPVRDADGHVFHLHHDFLTAAARSGRIS